jgi:BlaI family transcriptional regulator, penicillinase repressor
MFTDRELDIMDVLWAGGSATAAEVREQLKDSLAYTTVLTVLRILEEKGFVRHEEQGRTHRFYPLVGRDEAGSSAIERLLAKIFRGSPEGLLTHLVANHDLTDEELRRLRRLLDERLGEQ